MSEKIWVGLIEYDNGRNFYVSRTYEGLIRQVADWCEQNWNVPDETMPELHTPENDAQYVDIYFNHNDDEDYFDYQELELV